MLTPVSLTERLTVPLACRPPASYLLYAVIMHAGHSLDTGHYYVYCRASGGGGGRSGLDGAADCWWRLDDASAVPVAASAVLGQPRHPADTAYTLLYRLAASGAVSGQSPALATLPGPLQAAVSNDNALYRQERQCRSVSVQPPQRSD